MVLAPIPKRKSQDRDERKLPVRTQTANGVANVTSQVLEGEEGLHNAKLYYCVQNAYLQ